MIQEPDHFVITGPAVFHQGYNRGYNIAQAVNFGIPAWKSILKNIGSCYCIPKSWIVARETLLRICGASNEIKINSSIFRNVRCSQFLVIAVTQNYLTVEKELATLYQQDSDSDSVILTPIKEVPVRIFSIYSLRLFQVVRLKKISKNKTSITKCSGISELDVQEEEENNMAQSKSSISQVVNEEELGEMYRSRLSEPLEEEKQGQNKCRNKSNFTTLTTLKKSISELLKICFILPFTITGKIPVSPLSWDETFQIKWTLLERIFEKYHWQEIVRKLPIPSSSCTPMIGRSQFPITFREIQDNFNLLRSDNKIFISHSLEESLR